jgi:hypothetical protein
MAEKQWSRVIRLPWSRVPAKRAAEVAAKVPLSLPARELLKPELTPAEFLAQLITSKEHASAVAFLAHALPRREAVWWACLCVQVGPADGKILARQEQDALDAAVRWVLDPIEPHRRAAERPGRALGPRSLCGYIALAAFYSGGSVNPPGQPIRAPASVKTAQCITHAMLRIANKFYPRLRDEALDQFLAIGSEIADNRHRWVPNS